MIRVDFIDIDENLPMKGHSLEDVRSIIFRALTEAGIEVAPGEILLHDDKIKFGSTISAPDVELNGQSMTQIIDDALTGLGIQPAIETAGGLGPTPQEGPPYTLQLAENFHEGYGVKVRIMTGANLEFKVWNHPTNRVVNDNLLYHSGSPDPHVEGEVDAVPWPVFGVVDGKLYLDILSGANVRIEFIFSRVK